MLLTRAVRGMRARSSTDRALDYGVSTHCSTQATSDTANLQERSWDPLRQQVCLSDSSQVAKGAARRHPRGVQRYGRQRSSRRCSLGLRPDALGDRAGARANDVLASAPQLRAPRVVDELDRYDNRYIKLRAARDAHWEDLERVEAPVSEDALKQLEFAELLPPATVEAT